jgi:hypothetical protein
MDHGGNRSFRFSFTPADFGAEEPPAPLAWTHRGAWSYALGDFGSIKALAGLAPWIARLGGRLLGVYATLTEARIAVEAAALAAGHALAP